MEYMTCSRRGDYLGRGKDKEEAEKRAVAGAKLNIDRHQNVCMP